MENSFSINSLILFNLNFRLLLIVIMSINILQFTPEYLRLICEIPFANNYSFIYPSTTLYSIWANRTGILSLIKSLAHIILNFIICNLLDFRIVSKIIFQINIYNILISKDIFTKFLWPKISFSRVQPYTDILEYTILQRDW